MENKTNEELEVIIRHCEKVLAEEVCSAGRKRLYEQREKEAVDELFDRYYGASLDVVIKN